MKPQFIPHHFEDPDDRGCSWESMYRECRVQLFSDDEAVSVVDVYIIIFTFAFVMCYGALILILALWRHGGM